MISIYLKHLIFDRFLDSVFKHAISVFISNEHPLVVGKTSSSIRTEFGNAAYRYSRYYKDITIHSIQDDLYCNFSYLYEDEHYSDSAIKSFQSSLNNAIRNGCNIISNDYNQLAYTVRYNNRGNFILAIQTITEIVE